MPRRLNKEEGTKNDAVEGLAPVFEGFKLEEDLRASEPTPAPVNLEDEVAVMRERVEVVQPDPVPQNFERKEIDYKGEEINSKTPEEGLQSKGYEIVFSQKPLQCKFNGKYPTLAFNNHNQAVLVYNRNNFVNDMYYCVGKLNSGNYDIEWGKEHWYDHGAYPRIAVNNSGLVVEVHESPRKKKNWYHVGMIYNDNIDWGPSYEIGQGQHPAVALSNDDQVVIVEESGVAFSPESFYFFGKVNMVDKKILFSKKRELLVHSGKELSVAMRGNDIIVAFRHARNHRLHTMLGKIDGLSVSWAEYEFFNFAEGNWPSVSVNNDGVIVVNYQTYVNRQVFCREGQLKKADDLSYVQWFGDGPRLYDYGVYPSICLLEGNQLIEFHGTNKLNGNSMWYTIGYVKVWL